jgi:hypothetical protein
MGYVGQEWLHEKQLLHLQIYVEMDEQNFFFNLSWTFQFWTVLSSPIVVQNYPIKISDLPWSGT